MSAMQNKYKNFLLLTFCLALFLTACATPSNRQAPTGAIRDLDRETADLADVTADVLDLIGHAGNENVLVVFDIDNTLLAMEQDLGADQWYEWQKEINQNDKCNLQNVGDRFAVQGALYFASAMRATQDDALALLRTIQDTGVAVIALTSRGPDYRLQTFRELRRNGYSFTHSAIGPPGGYGDPFVPLEDGRSSRYEDGVFLTAGQHKGQMLYALLQKTGLSLPGVVVMTDDKQKNLDAVKETFAGLGVPVHAWRYTGEDQNVADFDPQQADLEWRSIEESLRQIQHVLGPDNYDLSKALLPEECNQ
jgi:hypothetical protein